MTFVAVSPLKNSPSDTYTRQAENAVALLVVIEFNITSSSTTLFNKAAHYIQMRMIHEHCSDDSKSALPFKSLMFSFFPFWFN